jgi:hypothetical protein
MSTTYSECVFVVLGIQHAMRMRHIILSSEAWSVLQYFSTLSHKRHDIRKNGYRTRNVFLFSLKLLSEAFLILRRIPRDVIKICIGHHVSNLYSCQILMTLELFYRFSKNTRISKFTKNPSSGSRVVPCGRTDGQT